MSKRTKKKLNPVKSNMSLWEAFDNIASSLEACKQEVARIGDFIDDLNYEIARRKKEKKNAKRPRKC